MKFPTLIHTQMAEKLYNRNTKEFAPYREKRQKNFVK